MPRPPLLFGLQIIFHTVRVCLVESELLPLHKKCLIILLSYLIISGGMFYWSVNCAIKTCMMIMLSCLIIPGGMILLKCKLCAIVSSWWIIWVHKASFTEKGSIFGVEYIQTWICIQNRCSDISHRCTESPLYTVSLWSSFKGKTGASLCMLFSISDVEDDRQLCFWNLL